MKGGQLALYSVLAAVSTHHDHNRLNCPVTSENDNSTIRRYCWTSVGPDHCCNVYRACSKEWKADTHDYISLEIVVGSVGLTQKQ